MCTLFCTVCSESFEGLSAKSNSRNGFCFQKEMLECLVIYQEDISILRLSTRSILIYFNPYLLIRGLSWPSSVQTSLTQNCLKLSIRTVLYLDYRSNSFLFLVVTLVLNSNGKSSIVEERLYSFFFAFFKKNEA